MSGTRSILDRLTYGLFAKNPVNVAANRGGFGQLGGNSGSGSGPLDHMESIGTLYSIVNLLATTTAQVDWHLYRPSVDGRRVYGPMEDNRRQVTTHPALNLLNRPNPLMTRNELFERGQMSIDLVGESFWLVVFARGMPIELWPARADRMDVVLDPSGNLVGWTYCEPDGSRTPFKLNEVIHVPTPSLSNPYRGMSPVQALSIDLASVRAAGMFNLNFFRSGARPGGIIQVPGSLGDTEFDRLTMQWREQHQGVNNAHRVGILEAGMEWVETSVSMLDMQFAELRNLSRDLIREAYRIHPHMLGQSDDVNKANAMAASADYATWQLKPRLERWQLALNGQLLPLFGDLGSAVEFNYADPMPCDPDEEIADRDSRVKAACLLIDRGFDAEETLAAFGLPDISHTAPEQVAPTTPTSIEQQLSAMLNTRYPRAVKS